MVPIFCTHVPMVEILLYILSRIPKIDNHRHLNNNRLKHLLLLLLLLLLRLLLWRSIIWNLLYLLTKILTPGCNRVLCRHHHHLLWGAGALFVLTSCFFTLQTVRWGGRSIFSRLVQDVIKNILPRVRVHDLQQSLPSRIGMNVLIGGHRSKRVEYRLGVRHEVGDLIGVIAIKLGCDPIVHQMRSWVEGRRPYPRFGILIRHNLVRVHTCQNK